MKLVNIGFGNIVSAQRIVAIVSPESAPIKRMVQEAKDCKTAVDATYGRHVILSAVQPETVAGRLEDRALTEEIARQMSETQLGENKINLKGED